MPFTLHTSLCNVSEIGYRLAAVGGAQALPGGGQDRVSDEADAAIAQGHVDAAGVPATGAEDVNARAKSARRIRGIRIAPAGVTPGQVRSAVVGSQGSDETRARTP